MSVSKYRYTTLLPDVYGDTLSGLFSVTAENDAQAYREIRSYLANRFALFRVKDEAIANIIINKQPEKLTDITLLKL